MSDYYQFRDETGTPVDYYQLVNDNNELCEEIERLNKENNDLRKLYQRTYKHLFEIGNDELARYFQAQIDECPTFCVEPIIDYYEETKRLNNIIKELEETIKNKIKGFREDKDYFIDEKDMYELDKLIQELKGDSSNE